MATDLYWPHDRTYRDAVNNEEYVGEGTHEVPDDRVDHFLDRGWQLPADAEEIDDQDTDELDELLDGTVDDVESEISAGNYDDQLDEIEDRADRAGVQDAVADRREALEG